MRGGMRLSIVVVAFTVLALAGCQRLSSSPSTPDASFVADAEISVRAAVAPHGPIREPPETLPPCPSGEGDYLQRAARHYDASRFSEALACAAQAAASDSANPDAHSERAAALVALGKLEEARTAYARALALNPDHEDALIGVADLYISRLPFSRDFCELGLAYAERGRTAARAAGDADLVGRFAVLEATALNDLGRAGAAAERADEAIAAGTDVDNARYEKASALWELCRFEEARVELERLVRVPERAAHAHYYLGLIAERAGERDLAGREIAQARKLDPDSFRPEPEVSREEYASMVARATQALPEAMKRDVAGVPITTQELPLLEDLIASEPPLSPTIVGLFRGPPLGEPCPPENEEPGPCRSIILYRKTMARSVKDRAELERQVEVTLLHEIGHLRGEDDTQLVARGLE